MSLGASSEAVLENTTFIKYLQKESIIPAPHMHFERES
jgi:hypothetical protein